MTHQNRPEQRLVDELRQRIAELDRASQQKETEATLILKTAPLGIHECDTDGRITFVNPCQEQITGYPADELVGTYIWDRIEPGPQKESLPDYLKHLVSEQPPPTPFVARNIRKNGEFYDIRVDWNYKRNPQGRVTGFVCIISDVTEQRRVAAALQESEERFRKVFEEGPLGVVLLGLDARIQHCNQRFCEMLGYSEEEIIALGLVGVSHPEDWEKDYRFGSRLLHGEIPNYTIDKRYVRKGGTVFWGQLTVSMMHDAAGKPTTVIGLIEDISERKQQLQREVEQRKAVEETSHQSRDELQTIYDEMVEGCLITDIETRRFVRVNSSFCRMLGYSEEELLAASVKDIHPPEEVTNDLRRFQAVADRQRSINENRPVLRKDGSIFYADISGRRILFNGRPCVLALFRDVTERRQAQEALRESEEKYKTLVETSPDAVIMADLTGHATFVSRRFLELYDAERADEFLGKTALDYMAPEDHQKGRRYFQKTLEDGITRDVEYSFIKNNGTRFPAELSAALVKDASGKPVAIISVLRDITERKRAEQILRQSHDELRSIYDSTVDGILVADAEIGHPIRVNAAYSRMLGYSGEELYNLSPEKVHSPEVLPKVWEHLETVKQGSVARIDDVPFLRKDGSTIYADVISSPICYNEQPGWISFFHDVTEHKQAQEALKREHRTLKHLLQSSDHERQLIAYEIHNGLAQQLAGAIMQFQTFDHLKDNRPRLAAKAYDAAMTMLRQGHFEARRLISGVRPPILDESGVVAAIAHLVSDQSRPKGPKIDYHSRVDFDRLAATLENAVYRIVQEGLTNACQHSKSEKVRVSLVQRGDRVQIEIRDWGIGFDIRSVQENRFGLVGIRQRARLLGGKCSIRSKTGKGTRVVVELPVVVSK